VLRWHQSSLSRYTYCAPHNKVFDTTRWGVRLTTESRLTCLSARQCRRMILPVPCSMILSSRLLQCHIKPSRHQGPGIWPADISAQLAEDQQQHRARRSTATYQGRSDKYTFPHDRSHDADSTPTRVCLQRTHTTCTLPKLNWIQHQHTHDPHDRQAHRSARADALSVPVAAPHVGIVLQRGQTSCGSPHSARSTRPKRKGAAASKPFRAPSVPLPATPPSLHARTCSRQRQRQRGMGDAASATEEAAGAPLLCRRVRHGCGVVEGSYNSPCVTCRSFFFLLQLASTRRGNLRGIATMDTADLVVVGAGMFCPSAGAPHHLC
jgi:hypothetical protein